MKTSYQTAFSLGFPTDDQGNPSGAVKEADVIVLQRQTDPRFATWIPQWRSEGKKVIYDIDDTLWHIPGYNPNKGFYSKKVRLHVEVIMMMCDAIICSTEPLARYTRKFNADVYVTPNLIEEFHTDEATSSRLRIGWGGSKTHIGDFPSKLSHVLKHCQKKYDAEIVWLGHRMLEIPKDILVAPTTMPDYLYALHSTQLDIAVAPLANNFFNECKSNLKFLEYASCKFPSVLSNSDAYSKSVEHGETGYIVKKKEWDEYIEFLCENESERKRIGNNAFNFVKDNYSWENSAEKHLSVYKEILGE